MLSDDVLSYDWLEPMYLNSFGKWKIATPELILRYSYYGMIASKMNWRNN